MHRPPTNHSFGLFYVRKGKQSWIRAASAELCTAGCRACLSVPFCSHSPSLSKDLYSCPLLCRFPFQKQVTLCPLLPQEKANLWPSSHPFLDCDADKNFILSISPFSSPLKSRHRAERSSVKKIKSLSSRVRLGLIYTLAGTRFWKSYLFR